MPGRHRLVVRIGERRFEMSPGERILLDEGVLEYRGLSAWMGYKIDYDWTRPWMLATAVIAILSLFAHYLRKFSRPARGLTGDPLLPRSEVRA